MQVDKHLFELPTLGLSVGLLGKQLMHDGVGGYIVEVEWYIVPDDRVAHSYGGRRTARTEVMFGPPGKAYVYTIHQHRCVNVVSGPEGAPEAILIRALEATRGLDQMKARRGRDADLTNGPPAFAKPSPLRRSSTVGTCSSRLCGWRREFPSSGLRSAPASASTTPVSPAIIRGGFGLTTTPTCRGHDAGR